MKYMKIITKIICVPIIVLLLMGTMGFTSSPQITKNETVYIILDHDGSVKDERVVNRVSGVNGDLNWIDFGKYDHIQNMVSEYVPEINGDEIIWPMAVLEMGDLYYQGTTDKNIPIKVTIKYYLEGKEIKGEELSGKSGDLKILIKIENKLVQKTPISYLNYREVQIENSDEYYVPMLVQVSVKADLDIYSDIKADDGSKVVIGKEMNIGFGGYPFPDNEYIIEMKGENIELAPINIIVIPQKLPFPDTGDAEKDLTEMADGLKEMVDGTYEMVDGLDEMMNRSSEIENGVQDLIDAIAEINHGAYELNNNSTPISSGMKDLIGGLDTLKSETEALTAGLNGINQGTGEIGSGLNQLADGAENLSVNIDPLKAGLIAFQSGHGDLVNLANAILATYPDVPGNAQIRALAQGVLAEETAIDGFVLGIQGISTGAAGLSTGLNELSANFSTYSSGINEIASGTGALPSGVGQLADGMRKLYDGWRDYSDGIAALYDGTQQFYDETIGFPDDINELLDGIKEIRDAIKKLIDEGIIEIEDGVIKSIDDIKYSSAMEKEVNELANDYNSFIDNDKNLNSEVQFVMQTEEIKIHDTKIANTQQDSSNNQTFFQKIINWFKKDRK